MRKTGFVTTAISLVLGVASEWPAVAVIILLWLIFLMPAVLIFSAWTQANRRVGNLIINLLVATGTWLIGLIFMLLVAGFTGSGP